MKRLARSRLPVLGSTLPLSLWIAFSLWIAAPALAQPGDPALIQSIPEGTGLEQSDFASAQTAWIQLIAGATRTIDMGQFYLANQAGGGPLEPVIQELEKAGKRGVAIRVIVDQAMIQNDPATYERFRKIPGLELRIYDLRKLTGGIIHAKYFVVDDLKVFVGSQNFDWRALTQIHETGVILSDARIASQLKQIFEIDWEICKTGEAPKPVTPAPTAPQAVELVASPAAFNPPGIRSSIVALRELLTQAQTSIRFQVMDYSTASKSGRWTEIDELLRKAAARGVKVELMVADWSLKKDVVSDLKALAALPNVLVRIVSFPDLASGCIPFARVMHTKILVIDNATLWVGTSNWSQGYFYNTRGVELIFKDAQLAAQGTRILDTLAASPYAPALVLSKEYSPRNKDCGTGGQ